jgi:hypothetical protein
VWGVELYGELLEIGGGKERMTKYFQVRGLPGGAADSAAAAGFTGGRWRLLLAALLAPC